MNAIDQKYAFAVHAMRIESKRRGISFKELIIRIASEKGFMSIPLWNDDFDARLIARSRKSAASTGGANA